MSKGSENSGGDTREAFVILGVLAINEEKNPVINTIYKDMPFYEVGEGKTVLLIHDLGSSHQCWADLVEKMEGYHVIIMDLYGHGSNDKVPGDLSLSGTADTIAGYLASKGMKDVVVVGHGMGGMITFEMLKTHDDLIKSFVLIDTASRQSTFNVLSKSIVKALNDDFEKSVEKQFSRYSNYQKLTDELTETALSTSRDAYLRYFEEMQTVNYTDVIKRNKKKSLIIFSKTYVKNIKVLARTLMKYKYNYLKSSEVEYFENAYHFIMIENTNGLFLRLSDFLKKYR